MFSSTGSQFPDPSTTAVEESDPVSTSATQPSDAISQYGDSDGEKQYNDSLKIKSFVFTNFLPAKLIGRSYHLSLRYKETDKVVVKAIKQPHDLTSRLGGT